MGFGRFQGSRRLIGAMSLAVAVVFTVPVLGQLQARAESENSAWQMLKKLKAGGASQDPGVPAATNWSYAGTGGGHATTETQIVNDGSMAPFLSTGSAAAMQAAETRFAEIVSSGGWGSVPGGKLKKGSQNKAVAALNRRLFIEGYLRQEAAEGQFADVYTTATEDAVSRFQRNHGLAVSGAIDGPTVKELNIPAERRLATIRANLPRIAEYSRDLGLRYVVVNVPAQQIESVDDGRVYSIHNAIVGRPSRPTPVVMTSLATVKFNPYWNAPPSIVERDILPRMLSGGASRVLRDMNIKVFDGVGGPEVNPDRINWRRAVVDNYQFRQEPGGENAMKTAKIEFNSPFGIYLHDTPEPHLFSTGARFYSSGCVRVDKVAILINWILNGQDGIGNARIAEFADTKERLDVTIANPPQLRVAYLTAWAGHNGEVNFRPDVYEMDGSGFVTGQPLPLDARSGGQRFVLKPVPRSPSAVDADEAFSFFNFGFGRSHNRDKETGAMAGRGDSTGNFLNLRPKNGKAAATASNWFSLKSNAVKKPVKKTAATVKKGKTEKDKVAAKKLLKKATGTAAATPKAADAAKTKKLAAKTDATAKTAAAANTPTAGKCKPGADGKLPAGCKAAAVVRPKVKPVADKTAAAN